MAADDGRRLNQRALKTSPLAIRDLLKGTLVMGGMTTLSPLVASAQQGTPGDSTRDESRSVLALARLLSQTKFTDLAPKAVSHAKMILASTLACAAAGSLADSTDIIRDLAKENGGKPEATIWHLGTCITSARLAVAERTGATGQGLIAAMAVGHEAAGRIFEARQGNRGGVHASQNVSFAGAIPDTVDESLKTMVPRV